MGAGASSVKPLQSATNPNLNGQNPGEINSWDFLFFVFNASGVERQLSKWHIGDISPETKRCFEVEILQKFTTKK
jgi:hypothetical protein